jgi:hypothetical protein
MIHHTFPHLIYPNGPPHTPHQYALTPGHADTWGLRLPFRIAHIQSVDCTVQKNVELDTLSVSSF